MPTINHHVHNTHWPIPGITKSPQLGSRYNILPEDGTDDAQSLDQLVYDPFSYNPITCQSLGSCGYYQPSATHGAMGPAVGRHFKCVQQFWKGRGGGAPTPGARFDGHSWEHVVGFWAKQAQEQQRALLTVPLPDLLTRTTTALRTNQLWDYR